MSTLVHPTAGRISFGPQVIDRHSLVRTTIGYVGHEPGFGWITSAKGTPAPISAEPARVALAFGSMVSRLRYATRSRVSDGVASSFGISDFSRATSATWSFDNRCSFPSVLRTCRSKALSFLATP